MIIGSTNAGTYTRDELASLWIGRESELSLLDRQFRNAGAHAAIIGQRGTGKTALAYMFCERSEQSNSFPGGCHRMKAIPFTSFGGQFDQFRGMFDKIETQNDSLLLVDDFYNGSIEFHSALDKYIQDNPAQKLLICSPREIPSVLRNPLIVRLGGLSQAEFIQLIEKRFQLFGIDERQLQELFDLANGNPIFADIAGKTIRENLVTFDEFTRGLHSFSRSGILGPDGKPIEDLPEASRLAIVDTNQILLEQIRRNPNVLHSIESRTFEVLVAELLSQRGYDVTLTPPSKDGGFDMYAARNDDLGSFLFLVECKRYTPPNKVGVSIIRSLHGVVQQMQANAGIVVTSSFFTKGAKEFQENVPHQMQLQDYVALQKWLGVI